MDEIITERSGSILRVELNRPAKKNAMTSAMYATLAGIFKDAGKDDRTRVVLWYGAGDFVLRRQRYRGFSRESSWAGGIPASSADECS